MKPAFLATLVYAVASSALLAQQNAAPPPRPAARQAEALKEYCRRAAQISPLHTEALFALGEWCREQGLEKEAQRSFREVIEIDTDHAGARAALGYSRYGTGWLAQGENPAASRPAGGAGLAGAPPAASAPPAAAPGIPAAGPTSKAASGAPAAAAPSPRAAARRAPEPAPPPASDGGTPAAEEVEEIPPPSAAGAVLEEVERKKAWAKAAAEKLQIEFLTFEVDDEFLVHTTHPSRQQQAVKLLVDGPHGLRKLKQTLATFLGVRGRAKIWPGKLQFVLLRSEQEYERFADMVDGVRYTKNPEGAYSTDDHTVLWKPSGEALARRLGETALDRLNGSDRWVGWWLKEGIAEMLLAQVQIERYKECYAQSAAYLGPGGSEVTIYSLLESPRYREQERERSRALALTLVDFLYQNVSKSGFQNLVKALKSDRAPAVPASGSDEQFKSFYLSYIAFQSEAIESTFHAKIPALEAGWKAHVEKKAEGLKPSQPQQGRQPGGRGRP
jgi:tetratricopeptide (TPR) repeat protein